MRPGELKTLFCWQKKKLQMWKWKWKEKLMMENFTLPASAYVAAGNGISYIKAPPFIDFNYFNAARVVEERFRSLREKHVLDN